MAQVEQKAECVVWNRAVAQLPVLPGTVGDLTAARGSGHTQAQIFAAVAKLFSGHKFFRLEVQDATPHRTQRHPVCKKRERARTTAGWLVVTANRNPFQGCRQPSRLLGRSIRSLPCVQPVHAASQPAATRRRLLVSRQVGASNQFGIAGDAANRIRYCEAKFHRQPLKTIGLLQ